MSLNAWQKISRVIPNKPFGDGYHGIYTSSTIPSIKYKSCSGSATSTTLTASTSTPFVVGDLVMIYQTRGTGATQWEINRIQAVGSGQYTMVAPLYYTYTDSGSSQAQVIEIKRYSNITTSSGVWSISGWAGDIYSVFPVACNGFASGLSIGGDGIDASGSNNANNTGGIGFNGGGNEDTTPSSAQAYCGEGTGGAQAKSIYANGNGGGGGYEVAGNWGGGGGGGNANAGSNGPTSGGGATGGTGGVASGSADLTSFSIGGAGGGGASGGSDSGGKGGNGGGSVCLFIKNISSITGISLTGGDSSGGGGSLGCNGGGGAGGSCLIVCQNASLGSNKIVATGGTGGLRGGNGSTGRVAIHYSAGYTGTSNPGINSYLDTSLQEVSPAGIFF